MDNHGSRERAKTGRQRSGLRAELEQMAVPFESVRRQIDGVQGWLRTVRRTEAAPVKEIAGRLGVLEREALRLETAEENGRITLGRLREVAQAMDYELVYALLPKETTFEDDGSATAEGKAGDAAGENAGTSAEGDEEEVRRCERAHGSGAGGEAGAAKKGERGRRLGSC